VNENRFTVSHISISGLNFCANGHGGSSDGICSFCVTSSEPYGGSDVYRRRRALELRRERLRLSAGRSNTSCYFLAIRTVTASLSVAVLHSQTD
jgi:hypothetical protein